MNLRAYALLLTTLLYFQVSAQNWGAVSAGDDVSFEFGFGAADYQGDLNNTPGFAIFEDPSFAYSVNLRKKFTPYFDISLQYVSSNLRATKNFASPDTIHNMPAFQELSSKVDNFTFNIHFDLAGVSYINKNAVGRRYKDSKYSLYLYTGIGISLTNAEVKSTISADSSQVIPIQTIRDIQNTFVVVPVGLGFKYYIYKSFSLGIEASYRIPFTDQLDATIIKNNNFDNFQTYFLTLGYTFRK